VSSEGRGIARLKNGVTTQYTTKNGLLSDTIFEILDDGGGCFWLPSPVGIARVWKKDLEDFSLGKMATIPCVTFGKSDGMASAQCESSAKPAACSSHDGRLWFSTIKGLAVVDPKSVQQNELPPPVMVEQIVASGEGTQRSKFKSQGTNDYVLASPISNFKTQT